MACINRHHCSITASDRTSKTSSCAKARAVIITGRDRTSRDRYVETGCCGDAPPHTTIVIRVLFFAFSSVGSCSCLRVVSVFGPRHVPLPPSRAACSRPRPASSPRSHTRAGPSRTHTCMTDAHTHAHMTASSSCRSNTDSSLCCDISARRCWIGLIPFLPLPLFPSCSIRSPTTFGRVSQLCLSVLHIVRAILYSFPKAVLSYAFDSSASSTRPDTSSTGDSCPPLELHSPSQTGPPDLSLSLSGCFPFHPFLPIV